MFRTTLYRLAGMATQSIPRSTAVTSSVISRSQMYRFPAIAEGVARPTFAARFYSSAMPEKMAMFCYQCEQTKDGKGCTTEGVCGKTPDVAAMQDLLVHGTKGVAMYAHRARELGAKSASVDQFIPHALFTTLTNVNFDSTRFRSYLEELDSKLKEAKTLYEDACKKAGKTPEKLSGPASWTFAPGSSESALAEQGKSVGVLARRQLLGDDVAGLQELITYGLKGMCAYADHAHILGQHDHEVYDFLHKALDFLTKPNPTLPELLGMALAVGEYNVRVLAKLNEGAVTRFGHPEPTSVPITHKKGKCILVSGHDLNDLELVLKQTEGKGINVYTHGELLPAHSYPGLKKYKHLIGNYGGAWQQQKQEFAAFPGPILMTTNCIIEPRRSYRDRIFTRSAVGWQGVRHLDTDDLSAVVESALQNPGFAEDEEPAKSILTGFGHNAVLGVADKVVQAVKDGHIKHFSLIGGCDGAEGERSYFRDVALAFPKDTMILTLACGKYRFNKLDFGTVAGLPRLLDVGQCNDAYSAVLIAQALAQAFKTDINGLPLSFVISWFEQKAVAVLLSLLHLGVKNIRLGPNLPAFVTPSVLQVLVDAYQIKPTGNVEEDVKNMLQEH